MVSPKNAAILAEKGNRKYKSSIARWTWLYCKFVLPLIIRREARHGFTFHIIETPRKVSNDKVVEYLKGKGFYSHKDTYGRVKVEWTERALKIMAMRGESNAPD